VLPCVDFAHIHTRSNGKFNSYDEFKFILENIERIILLKVLKEFKVKGVVISESPNIEKDAILMKKFMRIYRGKI